VAADKVQHAVRVVAARLDDGIEEDLVELIDELALSGVVGGRLVDGLERQARRLALEPVGDLDPDGAEAFLDLVDVGAGDGDVGPLPAVMVDWGRSAGMDHALQGGGGVPLVTT
jgi:hypothetical protein